MGGSEYLASHDQNFKNLAVDYPIQSIEFFAHEVFPKIEGNPRVTLLRQEQQKKRLSQHHRELDIPILLEWEDGDKAVVIFAIEAESNPYKFDAVRLAQYCLDLVKQHQTKRVVPVVVFTKSGKFAHSLRVGTEEINVMNFQFAYCQLPMLDYKQWCDSDNIVARLTLPLMDYTQNEKLDVVHKSTEGLLAIEPNEVLQRKYVSFIGHYANLSESDIIEYQRRYPQEGEIMTSYIQQQMQRSVEEGLQQGMQQGIQQGVQEGLQQGERLLLLRQLKRRFAKQVVRAYENKVLQASREDIERWADNILEAKTIEEVFV